MGIKEKTNQINIIIKTLTEILYDLQSDKGRIIYKGLVIKNSKTQYIIKLVKQRVDNKYIYFVTIEHAEGSTVVEVIDKKDNTTIFGHSKAARKAYIYQKAILEDAVDTGKAVIRHYRLLKPIK